MPQTLKSEVIYVYNGMRGDPARFVVRVGSSRLDARHPLIQIEAPPADPRGPLFAPESMWLLVR